MRKRSGIVAVVAVGWLGALGGLGAVVSACGASSANISGVPGSDGGVPPFDGPGVPSPDASASDGSVPSGDGGGADSGNPPFDAAASDAPPPEDASNADSATADAGGPTTILAVHASANLFPFRVCFGGPAGIFDLPPYPNDPAHPMPETNFPGVPIGGAALLPPVKLAGLVTPYVVSTARLEGDSTSSCAVRLCPTEMMPSDPCVGVSEFAALPQIMLPPGATVVLAVQGCLPLASAPGKLLSNAQCGAGYEGSPMGNLTATLSVLDPPFAGGGLALHVAQLSPSSPDASLTYVDPTIDASIPLSATELSAWTTATTVPLSEAGALSASFVTTTAAAPAVTQSLAAMQFFQAPSSNPTTYFNSTTPYFAAIVGDATDASAPWNLPDGAANPAFNGYGLHVIAYPERGN